MSVYGQACYAESIAQNDVRGFATNTWQCGQFLHALGYETIMALQKHATAGNDVFRLVTEKSRTVNNAGDVLFVGTG